MVIKDERDLGRSGDGDGVWPKREVHADGTVTESWEGIHEYPERLVREAAERMRSEGATSATHADDTSDDPWTVSEVDREEQPADWLDDYEEGSTSEEFLDRLKHGMVITSPDDDPGWIAAEAMRRSREREAPANLRGCRWSRCLTTSRQREGHGRSSQASQPVPGAQAPRRCYKGVRRRCGWSQWLGLERERKTMKRMIVGLVVATLLVAPATSTETNAAHAAHSVKVYDAYSHQGTVYRLYRAYFLREPDGGGYEYWLHQFERGYPVGKISEDFTRSAEFKSRYGDVDNREFIRRVYINVLEREPDEAGYQYWLDQMSRGMLRGFVMIYFSDSDEFRGKTRSGMPSGYRPLAQWLSGETTQRHEVFVNKPVFVRANSGVYADPDRPLSFRRGTLDLRGLDANSNFEETIYYGEAREERLVHRWEELHFLDMLGNGPWNVELLPMNAAPFVSVAAFDGTRSAVRQTVQLSNAQVRFTHQGSSNFIVYALDSNARPIALLANEIGNATDVTTVPAGTRYVEIIADGQWSFRAA